VPYSTDGDFGIIDLVSCGSDSRLGHRFLAVKKVGYCRVSNAHHSLDRQLDAVRAEGVGVIFRAKSSGKRGPQLEKTIERPWQRRNIIAEQDRSTSSVCDGGVHLMSIQEGGVEVLVPSPTVFPVAGISIVQRTPSGSKARSTLPPSS
jgi:hypothetical protein